MKAWKAPEKARGVPKKGNSPPRFWQTRTSLTGLTARLIGLSGCLLLLQNGLDRQITQADDVLQCDFLRCPWPTHLLHLALNHCWMTSPFWTSNPYKAAPTKQLPTMLCVYNWQDVGHSLIGDIESDSIRLTIWFNLLPNILSNWIRYLIQEIASKTMLSIEWDSDIRYYCIRYNQMLSDCIALQWIRCYQNDKTFLVLNKM